MPKIVFELNVVYEACVQVYKVLKQWEIKTGC